MASFLLDPMVRGGGPHDAIARWEGKTVAKNAMSTPKRVHKDTYTGSRSLMEADELFSGRTIVCEKRARLIDERTK